MWDNAQIVTLLPNINGQGAAKTAIPSMTNVADIRDAKNVLIKVGRWENILGSTAVSTGGPTANASLYCYFFHSTSVPVTTTTKVLAAGTISGTGTIRNMTDSANLVTLTAGGNPVSFETVKEKCYFSDGATLPQVIDGQNAMAVYPWGIFPASALDNSGVWVDYAKINSITYDTTTAWTDTLHFDITAGTQTINIHSGGADSVPDFASLGSVNGQSIWLNGTEMTAPGNRHDVTDYVIGGSGVGTLTIDPPPTLAEIGGSSPAMNVACQVNWGNMSWTNGSPGYALSFYDSTRAHSGNIGTKVFPVEPVKYNVTPILRITGNATISGGRCDELILWAYPFQSTGAVMQTLAVLPNLSSLQNYTDVRKDDNTIGTLIGNFGAPSPGTYDNSPPKYFTSVAYWNGVMWGLAPTGPLASDFDLSLLYYTRVDDFTMLGRGEESWQVGTPLRISARDGRGLGLVIIGDNLCVLTERYIYAVIGTSDGSYRLAQISSRGLGVGQFQMAEYAGDSTKATAAMIFLGQDRQFWAQAPGDVPVYLSGPVQDQIDAALRGPTFAALYPNIRVHYITYSGDTYAMILLN